MDLLDELFGIDEREIDDAITECEDRLKKLKALRKVVGSGGTSTSGNSKTRPPRDEEGDREILDAAFGCVSRAEWDFSALRGEIGDQLKREVPVGKLRHLLKTDPRFQKNSEGRWTTA